MELEITWKRAIKVWWAYLWRSILVFCAAGIVGAMLGAVLGVLFRFSEIRPDLIQIIVMLVAGLIGICISIVPIKMILGKDFGEFRLILVEDIALERR